MNIRQATLEDLDQLVPLFDCYRQFYEQLDAIYHNAPPDGRFRVVGKRDSE